MSMQKNLLGVALCLVLCLACSLMTGCATTTAKQYGDGSIEETSPANVPVKYGTKTAGQFTRLPDGTWIMSKLAVENESGSTTLQKTTASFMNAGRGTLAFDTAFNGLDINTHQSGGHTVNMTGGTQNELRMRGGGEYTINQNVTVDAASRAEVLHGQINQGGGN